ncbi:hypothetical protein ACQUKI_20870 [Ralstonia pseudosolanacearum]
MTQRYRWPDDLVAICDRIWGIREALHKVQHNDLVDFGDPFDRLLAACDDLANLREKEPVVLLWADTLTSLQACWCTARLSDEDWSMLPELYELIAALNDAWAVVATPGGIVNGASEYGLTP